MTLWFLRFIPGYKPPPNLKYILHKQQEQKRIAAWQSNHATKSDDYFASTSTKQHNHRVQQVLTRLEEDSVKAPLMTYMPSSANNALLDSVKNKWDKLRAI